MALFLCGLQQRVISDNLKHKFKSFYINCVKFELERGGAFLIPYLIVLIFIGKPLYFLEMALGQFSSYGSVKIWEVVPILKGKSWTSLFIQVNGLQK